MLGYITAKVGLRGRFKPEDFLPPWLRPEPKTQSPDVLGAIFQGWADANHLHADGRRSVAHQ